MHVATLQFPPYTNLALNSEGYFVLANFDSQFASFFPLLQSYLGIPCRLRGRRRWPLPLIVRPNHNHMVVPRLDDIVRGVNDRVGRNWWQRFTADVITSGSSTGQSPVQRTFVEWQVAVVTVTGFNRQRRRDQILFRRGGIVGDDRVPIATALGRNDRVSVRTASTAGKCFDAKRRRHYTRGPREALLLFHFRTEWPLRVELFC